MPNIDSLLHLDIPLTALQLIPQIIINYRRHNTIGLQRSMMFLWACAGVPLGAYNISSNFNIALQIQPQILTVLSLITWGQCFHYDDVSFSHTVTCCAERGRHGKIKLRLTRGRLILGQKWGTLKCTLFVVGIAACFGGVETGLTFALKVCCESQIFFLISLRNAKGSN